MAVSKIQNQVSFTQKPNIDTNSGNVNMERLLPLPRKHYLNHNEIPDSVNRIRPEPGQGHLLNGGFFSSLGRFFSNRIYDIKSVYKGYTGTANDHQLGRTNDVGLVLGGLGIASFLTTKRIATMPKHMEFIGLASFLSSMALWPKIGIFGPARAVHGFDADKRYIDDQGRNKSVFQDPNYVPFELFRGDKKSEDISAIADYMGISKDAPNRNEMAKDQMRKVATQNHTLWMLTSGVAVPTLTALLCNGFERIYEPLLVKYKNSLSDSKLNKMYETLINSTDKKHTTPKPAKKIANQIRNFATVNRSEKVLTGEQITNFVNTVAKDAGSGVSAALAKDIRAILAQPDKAVVDNKYIEEIAKNIEAKFQGHNLLKKGIVSFDEIVRALCPIKAPEKNAANDKKPSADDIIKAFKEGKELTKDQVDDVIKKGVLLDKERVNKAITKAVNDKLAAADFTNTNNIPAEKIRQRVIDMAGNVIRNNAFLPKSETYVMTEGAANNIKSIAGAMGEYLYNFRQLRGINELKMGNVADSMDAYLWKKLETAFTNIVYPNNVFTSKSFKPLIDNTSDIEKTAQANIEKLVKDDERYAKAIKKIDALKTEYLKAVFGNDERQYIQYNEFIKGNNAHGGVNWNARTYSDYGTQIDKYLEIETKLARNFYEGIEGNKRGLFNNLLTTITNNQNGNNFGKTVTFHDAATNVKKVENFVTACDRIIHSLDIYRRAYLNPVTKPLEQELFNEAKHNVISAQSNDFFARFNNRSKSVKFRQYMDLIFAPNKYLDDLTKANMSKASRYTMDGWIDKLRAILFNDKKKWQYSEFGHNNCPIGDTYNDNLLSTPDARYRAQGKNPVEFLNQGLKNSYNSNKWLRMFGGLFIGVFSLSVIAQFFFGKKDSTIPLEKDRLKQEKLNQQNAIDNQINQELNEELEVEAAHAN